MVSEVLPDVPWVQLVFTIPKMLRPLFLWDRTLYGDLCRSAYAATRRFFEAQFPRLEKPVPAMIVAPQSHGSLLNFHPHAHGLSAQGVFSRDGVFHPAPENLDSKPLEDLFREEIFKVLLRREKITEERVRLLRSWRHSGFRVDSSRRIPQGDRKALESLLQYFERAPVALSRLEYLDDGRVLYRGNFHPSLRRDYQLVSRVELLAMLVPHIALPFECRIYSYGALSTTIRRAFGWIKKNPQEANSPEVVVAEEESEFVKLRRRTWARLISRVYLEDPSLCRSCQKPMRIISALTSPQQDEAIEKILRHRQQWHPPWQIERKARGPPTLTSSSSTTTFAERPSDDDEDSGQIPPDHDNWDI